MRVGELDEECLKTMKDAGCYIVSYGFESYSSTVLKSMRKYITPQQIDRAVHTTLKNNVSIQGNFIFGDVAETTQTANETLAYWKRNSHAGIMLTFISPYPGSHLYRHCLERGIIKDKLDFIANHISDKMNMSDTMTDEEFERLKVDIFEAELRYRISTVPRSLKKTVDGTYNISVKCPHCGEMIEYKNCLISFGLLRLSFIPLMMYCRKCRHRFFLVGRLYKIWSRLLLVFCTIMNPRLKIITYNFVGEIIKSSIKQISLRFVK